MAKVLTEQPRYLSSSFYDPQEFGDGAPLHSAIAFDASRWLNNMQTFREPSFQFLHDISIRVVGGLDSRERIRYQVRNVGVDGFLGDGFCMLGQAPIYVPVDATRLRWSLGLYRDPAFSVEGTEVEIDVNNVTMYLSSEPCRQLSDIPVGLEHAEDEIHRRSSVATSLTGAWTSNTVLAGAGGSSNGPNTVYTKVRSNTWTDFAPRGVANINDRTGDPWAYIIVEVAFANGVENEIIRGAELSLWFEYDDAPFLIDDGARGPARNGRPAMAQVMRRIITAANKFSIRARPLINWWGGNPGNPFDTSAESTIRRMRLTRSAGGSRLGGQALILPIAAAASVPKTGLQITEQDDDQTRSFLVPQTPGVLEDLNEAQAVMYPRYATSVPLFDEHEADYAGGAATAREIRIQAGDTGPAYGPQLRSGLIFERRPRGRVGPVVGSEALPLDPYSLGSEIIGEGSALRDMRAVREFINRLMIEKSIHFGWGICKNSTSGTYGHNVTSTFGTSRRYILNTAYGEGGIAPTVDGPGIEIPARYTGVSRNTTVRAYVRVYARMTGGTSHGTLSYYNRNNAGGMAGPTALIHPPDIAGTTWQWYPNTDTVDEANDPYLVLNANPAYDCDNLVLCGGRNSATDDLLIGAWTICVRASEA